MSLKSDMVVIRNGRCTSQISIYNYPEHLNPFYDDDQHKRLRFWKIQNNDKDEGRRHSFSIANLKDLWSFKSFNLKKKQSSTLGINKTSESPPLLRRQLIDDHSNNQFLKLEDRRTKNAVSAQGSPVFDENFMRNNLYRSSLQNIRTTSAQIVFHRNNQYRSTYQFSGSTPLAVRLSQSSLASTNPFDSDDDVNQFKESKILKRYRKKKRAPLPPTIKNELDVQINIENNATASQHCIENNKNIDIISLTAEIENYVKIYEATSDNINNIHEEEINKAESNNKVLPLILETKEADLSPQESPIVDDRVDTSPKLMVSQCNKEQQFLVEKIVAVNSGEKVNKLDNLTIRKETEVVEKIPSKLSGYPESSKAIGTLEPTRIYINNENNDNKVSNLKRNNNISSFKIYQMPNSRKVTKSTLITLTQSPEGKRKSNSTNNAEENVVTNFSLLSQDEISEILNQPLKIIETETEQRGCVDYHFNKPAVEGTAVKNNNSSKGKRSVKDIIESINRSQQILNKSASKGTKVYSTGLYNQTNTSYLNKNIELNKVAKSGIYLQANEDVDMPKLNNDNSFQKCKINKIVCQYRETSPTSSNLDWNPLPKPKRTTNISEK